MKDVHADSHQRGTMRNVPATDWILKVQFATPIELIELERNGVPSMLIRQLSEALKVPLPQLCTWLGVPVSARNPRLTKRVIKGAPAQAAIGMALLLSITKGIITRSTLSYAPSFDAGRWLGVWLSTPHVSLSGKQPGQLADTRVGLSTLVRLLASIESGAYS